MRQPFALAMLRAFFCAWVALLLLSLDMMPCVTSSTMNLHQLACARLELEPSPQWHTTRHTTHTRVRQADPRTQVEACYAPEVHGYDLVEHTGRSLAHVLGWMASEREPQLLETGVEKHALGTLLRT